MTEPNLKTLYEHIADVEDEYTRQVLYSQFIDKYYPEAFEAMLSLFKKGQVHKVLREKKEEKR